MDQSTEKPKDFLSRFKKIKFHKLFHEKSNKISLAPNWSQIEGNKSSNIRRSLRKIQFRIQNSSIFHRNDASIKLNSCSSNKECSLEVDKSNMLDKISEDPSKIIVKPEQICDEKLPLVHCSWYWGPLSQSDANKILNNSPDGSFLIRDSSSTSYLYSISFRCVGLTFHSRIEHIRGKYRLFDNGDFSSIPELVENAIKKSTNAIFCYTTNDQVANVNFPVRFVNPLSRYSKVQSLKFLCRFVVRQCTNLNDITKLPLPSVLHSYLQERNYFY